MASHLTVTIDVDSTIPVYRQIADALRQLLVELTLKPGMQLPPVRQLSVDLGVHFNTVAQAYRTLADEGWLDLRRRRGALILDRVHPTAPSKARQRQSLQRLREIIAQLRSEGISPSRIAQQLRDLADGLEEL